MRPDEQVDVVSLQGPLSDEHGQDAFNFSLPKVGIWLNQENFLNLKWKLSMNTCSHCG